MPLLDCDLGDLLTSCALGNLSAQKASLSVLPKTSAVTVVMASGGYPGAYKKGFPISGLERARCVPGVTVFHAGTTNEQDSKNNTNGATHVSKDREQRSHATTRVQEGFLEGSPILESAV